MSELTDPRLRIKLHLPYEDAVERVRVALKEQGFGVLTEIDVKATLKQKLNVDFRKYVILGACNPPLAHQALGAELELGLFLPCNAIVYEEDGGSVAALMDPMMMAQMIDNPLLEQVAGEARRRLEAVIASLR